MTKESKPKKPRTKKVTTPVVDLTVDATLDVVPATPKRSHKKKVVVAEPVIETIVETKKSTPRSRKKDITVARVAKKEKVLVLDTPVHVHTPSCEHTDETINHLDDLALTAALGLLAGLAILAFFLL